jgi:hypothetical protein
MEKEILIYSPGENSDNDFLYEMMIDELAYELKKTRIKNKVLLVAYNANWRGKTGFAVCNADAKSIFSKVMSFDNEEATLCKDGRKLYFKTASHDVPTGFSINIVAATKYLLEDGSLNLDKAVEAFD